MRVRTPRVDPRPRRPGRGRRDRRAGQPSRDLRSVRPGQAPALPRAEPAVMSVPIASELELRIGEGRAGELEPRYPRTPMPRKVRAGVVRYKKNPELSLGRVT